jgi:hypothetical protein
MTFFPIVLCGTVDEFYIYWDGSYQKNIHIFNKLLRAEREGAISCSAKRYSERAV